MAVSLLIVLNLTIVAANDTFEEVKKEIIALICAQKVWYS